MNSHKIEEQNNSHENNTKRAFQSSGVARGGASALERKPWGCTSTLFTVM